MHIDEWITEEEGREGREKRGREEDEKTGREEGREGGSNIRKKRGRKGGVGEK